MTSATTPATSPAPTGVPYFFLLRLQWPTHGGMAATVMHGTHVVRPGESRQQIFIQLRDLAIAKAGAPATADIATFIFEPDRLV